MIQIFHWFRFPLAQDDCNWIIDTHSIAVALTYKKVHCCPQTSAWLKMRSSKSRDTTWKWVGVREKDLWWSQPLNSPRSCYPDDYWGETPRGLPPPPTARTTVAPDGSSNGKTRVAASTTKRISVWWSSRQTIWFLPQTMLFYSVLTSYLHSDCSCPWFSTIGKFRPF